MAAGIMERAPRCTVCGVPSIWAIVRDPTEGWMSLDELGWMCPGCIAKSGQRAEELHWELCEQEEK